MKHYLKPHIVRALNRKTGHIEWVVNTRSVNYSPWVAARGVPHSDNAAAHNFVRKLNDESSKATSVPNAS